MTDSLTIGIVGCGTAGLATAIHLTRDGHKVTLFEAFNEPRPVGAGLMLQPTGLACLATLGLDQAAIENGARVGALIGHSATGRTIFDLHYDRLAPHLFGVGIHRGMLFHLLFSQVVAEHIPIQMNCRIVRSDLRTDMRVLIDDAGQEYGPFDLVIDASGRQSMLRPDHLVKMNKPNPYAAIWTVVNDPDQSFGQDRLAQKYDGAHVMIGVLPVGKSPDSETKKSSFFWSLPADSYDQWRAGSFEDWKNKVLSYWPDVAPLLAQITGPDDMTLALYNDIVLSRWHDDRLIFVGDAAHNTSPQLGQGANLALADALTLRDALRDAGDVNMAGHAYTKARRRHVRFYQLASRLLTPFFQSNSRLAGLVRDIGFGPMCHLPFLGSQMIQTMAGIKTGALTRLDPGKWDGAYRIKDGRS